MNPDVFEMTSSRPYLLRAVYEWITDNDLTPQIVVDAQQEQVRVPTAYVREGKIVLNISSTAVRGSASAMSGWNSAPASAALPAMWSYRFARCLQSWPARMERECHFPIRVTIDRLRSRGEDPVSR